MVEDYGFDLSTYGTCIASYGGVGVLTDEDGTAIQCVFETGQLTDGEIVFLCACEDFSNVTSAASPLKFEGTTTQGSRISVRAGFTPRAYLPDRTPGLSTALAFKIGRAH